MSNITRTRLARLNRKIPAAGRQTIVLTVKRFGAADTDVTIANAEKRPVTRRMQQYSNVPIITGSFEVIITEYDLQIGLTAASLSTSEVPQVDDVIALADGSECRIVQVRREMLETRHRCMCYPHLGS